MNSLMLFSMQELSDTMVQSLNNTLGIWYLVILNAFGVIAILCKVTEYQVKKHGTMMVIATIANVSWVLYFALNGNFTAALTCVLIVIRMLIYMQRNKSKWAKSNFWVILFVVLQTIVAITTFKYWQDVFSILAGYIGIFAYLTKNQTKYRILSFIYMSLWLSNSISYLVGSISYLLGTISDTFSTISVAVGIWRYDLSKKAKEEKKALKKTTNLE